MARKKTHKQAQSCNRRYKGILPASVALAACGAVLAIIYMLPAPRTIPQNARPPFEDFTSRPVPAPRQPQLPPPRQPVGPMRPRVAIIIDDMGYDYALDEAFLRLEAPISYAFLPFAPNTRKFALQAASMGRDVMVHIPMEPKNGGINPGPGVLRLDMDFETLVSTLKKDLDAVPCATGANNHMGSRFTENTRAMETVLTEIGRRHMFFIDSRTSARTVAYDVARKLGVPAGRRAVFLDHNADRKAVRHELSRLVSLAFRHGEAIAIGHPLEITLKVLYRELPVLQKKIRLVPVHELLRKKKFPIAENRRVQK